MRNGTLLQMAVESNLKSKIVESKSDLVVVVADNCQDNLTFISFILDALKYKYYLAKDGRTALNLVLKKQPDLVLLDIVMPEMNGIEVNVLIKNNQLYQSYSYTGNNRINWAGTYNSSKKFRIQ